MTINYYLCLPARGERESAALYRGRLEARLRGQLDHGQIQVQTNGGLHHFAELHSGASPHSLSVVKYFLHVHPAVGLILQLMCSPIGNLNFRKKTSRMRGRPILYMYLATETSMCIFKIYISSPYNTLSFLFWTVRGLLLLT